MCLCSEPPWNKVQADGWNYYELLQAISMKMIVGRAINHRWRENYSYKGQLKNPLIESKEGNRKRK